MVSVKLLRSMLYVPGNDMRKIKKGAKVEADALILDLEDSVPIDEKETGRVFVRDSIEEVSSGDIEIYVRINGPETGFFEDDIDEVVREELDGIVLPKSETKNDIDNLVERVDELGLESDLSIVPLIETCEGIVNLRDIASNSDWIDALAFGAVDYSGDLGTEISEDEIGLLYPRSKISNICSALGIQAIDTPWTEIADKEGLTMEAEMARKLGFDGKQLIHPNHLDTINKIFSPSEEEVEFSRKVVEAFEEAEKEGLGTASLEGEMIDIATYKKAKRTLAKAEAIEGRK